MKQFHDILVRHAPGGGEQAHTRTAPKIHKFKIDKGLVTWGGVYFPAGCVTRVFAKMFFQAHQILPRNQESWMHGENGWWAGDLDFIVDASPLTVKIIAFQEAAAGGNLLYDHEITAAIEVKPFEMIPAWDKVTLTLTKIGKLLGVKVN